ncbi:MAG: C45 family autoproteolytic acyltransferase/hydrolase [Candidatus Edwardsbacteria bacterium]
MELTKPKKVKAGYLLLVLIALLIGCCGRNLGKRIESGTGYRQDEEGIVVVHLRGSDDEIKSQLKALLADEITDFYKKAMNHRLMRTFGYGGCTNFAAFGKAATDGKLWHARNFDLGGNGVLDCYRVVYIIEPIDKIPFISIAFADSCYLSLVHTGMNAKGIALGYMHSEAPDESIMDAPNLWALFRKVMENASTIEEALAILKAGPRKGVANLLLADGKVPEAVVVEMTSKSLAVRRANEGIVYATNHFVSKEMFYPEDKDPNSYGRFERLGKLAEQHYGKFDLKQTVAILRDHYDVYAGRAALGGDIIATPTNVLSVVFCPSDLTFWVAKAQAPASFNEFVGFNLLDEVKGTQAKTTVPSVPADPIVGSPAWKEMEKYLAGNLAYLFSDDSTAVEHLSKAVSLNPHSALYGYRLGVALVNMGKKEEAIAAFNDALSADSHISLRAYIYYRLGRLYEEMGDKDKMQAAFEKVLELDIGDKSIEDYAQQALGW